jgi:hypothetical protein
MAAIQNENIAKDDGKINHTSFRDSYNSSEEEEKDYEITNENLKKIELSTPQK